MSPKGSEILHRRERFFLVSSLASEGKTDERKKFAMAEKTVKVCLLYFGLQDLRKCVTDSI